MRRLNIFAACLLALAAARPAAADWPAWVERWLFNPEERTRQALDAYQEGEVEGAVDPLETALRLRGDHPITQFNAGTARLDAETGDALSLLEAAAESGSEELIPRARYNLGNARMAGGDLEGAIEAYQEALRHAPDLDDAKFNLELAQKLLQEQQQEQQEQEQDGDSEQDEQEQQEQEQEQQDQQHDGDSEQDEQEQQEQQEQEQEQQDQQQQQQEQQDEQGQQEQEQQEQEQEQEQQQQQESPLPQFQDLPDMTAEEAAAILEAIENMEREQLRQEALEAARRQPGGGKDW